MNSTRPCYRQTGDVGTSGDRRILRGKQRRATARASEKASSAAAAQLAEAAAASDVAQASAAAPSMSRMMQDDLVENARAWADAAKIPATATATATGASSSESIGFMTPLPPPVSTGSSRGPGGEGVKTVGGCREGGRGGGGRTRVLTFSCLTVAVESLTMCLCWKGALFRTEEERGGGGGGWTVFQRSRGGMGWAVCNCFGEFSRHNSTDAGIHVFRYLEGGGGGCVPKTKGTRFYDVSPFLVLVLFLRSAGHAAAM